MYRHMPLNYICPFCLAVNGEEDEENKRVQTKQQDIIYKDDHVTALIATLWWPNNKGHVIIIPNDHYENIFDLPLEIATRIHELARQVALALKECYGCDGISTRQHNEPGGSQDVWHYHLHVYPRSFDDDLYLTHGVLSDPSDRFVYAEKLRGWFRSNRLSEIKQAGE
ncbi:HIT family protein [uncultured Rossellomorea sp.]|uniref:HIT family protein n=1 Tax=uncultured Rossellomorea sp. TaxID=2837549 RepID=UPI002632EF87|nr:HIT family protein [uncultured Rossellomorea sp.]